MVATIVGEGGSGGAIALAAANRVLMFEHAVYSVISPEGCASILWKDAEKMREAAEALRAAEEASRAKAADTGGGTSTTTVTTGGGGATPVFPGRNGPISQRAVQIRRHRPARSVIAVPYVIPLSPSGRVHPAESLHRLARCDARHHTAEEQRAHGHRGARSVDQPRRVDHRVEPALQQWGGGGGGGHGAVAPKGRKTCGSVLSIRMRARLSIHLCSNWASYDASRHDLPPFRPAQGPASSTHACCGWRLSGA